MAVLSFSSCVSTSVVKRSYRLLTEPGSDSCGNVSDKFRDTVKFVHDLLRRSYYSSRYKGFGIFFFFFEVE